MITIIGNALNSTNKKILDKMHKMDFEFIKREVCAQLKEGAEFIELNAGPLLDDEIAFLRKTVPIIEGYGGKVLVRSKNLEAFKEVLDIAKNEILIGDIEYNQTKIDGILDITKNKKSKIIALIKDNNRNEDLSPEHSLLIAQMYIDYLLDKGMNRCDILLDPIVRPLEDDFLNGRTFLNTLELFKLDFPQVKTIANLTRISNGLPRKYLLAAHFVSLAIEKGLDYLVINVLEKPVVESVITTMTIIGKDKNMHTYLNFCRNTKDARNKDFDEEDEDGG